LAWIYVNNYDGDLNGKTLNVLRNVKIYNGIKLFIFRSIQVANEIKIQKTDFKN